MTKDAALARIALMAQIERDHADAKIEDRRRRVAAAWQGQPEALNGTLGGPEMVLAVLPLAIEQAHDEALHHLPKDCPDPRRACGRCTSPAAARAARGDDSAYHCGRPWVAEIQKCPRCGLTADKHPRTPPVEAAGVDTKRDVLRDLYSLRNRALTSTGWLHREEQLRLLDSIEAWVRAQP